jgi:hypothetical protein
MPDTPSISDKNRLPKQSIINALDEMNPQQLLDIGNACFERIIKHPELQDITKGAIECYLKKYLKNLHNA